MDKYKLNYFKYAGLGMLSVIIQVHLDASIDFLVIFLITISLACVSLERMEK